MTASELEAIDAVVGTFMKKNAIRACSIGLGRGSALIFTKGYGRAGARIEADADTVYRIGSVTKQFTAALALMASQGRLATKTGEPLDLDMPLSVHFPDQKHWTDITLRHLLTHVSGLPTYTATRRWRRHQFRPIRPKDLLKLVQGYKPDFKPAAKGHYSNTNYLLLAHMLERHTGKHYSDLLREYIFRPLGMTATRVISPGIPKKQEARGTVKGRFTSRRTHPNWAFGVGDLQSSVGDLARWNMALLGGRLLSHASLQLMFTAIQPNREPAMAGEKLAMGWMDISNDGVQRFYHQGYLHGFSAVNYVTDPLAGPKTFVTVLCNAHLAPELPQFAVRIGRAF